MQPQCYICKKPAKNECENCGQPVCNDHYNPTTRTCTKCTQKPLGGGEELFIPESAKPIAIKPSDTRK